MELTGAARPEEMHFQLDHLQLAGRRWGDSAGFPVLALHGWLDNAASFDLLAPCLRDCQVVALDCAGHGYSGHRHSYPIWQDVEEVFQVADQLGWERFALLGHSRGAIISALAAGTFPERVSHLALLDGLFPATMAAGDAPDQLARAIRDNRRYRERGFPVYPDRETALRVRQRGPLAIGREAAARLLERGAKTVEGGLSWRSDPRLKAASPLKLSAQQVDAFIDAITAPALLVLAEEGVARKHSHMEKLEERSGFRIERLGGGHHLHMESSAVPDLASLLMGFFRQADA